MLQKLQNDISFNLVNLFEVNDIEQFVWKKHLAQ